MKDCAECAKLEQALQSLLNKVNLVTAPHRHGQGVPKKALDELANRQIEVEELLAKFKAQ